MDYNNHMARGWESKAVEDQISAAEAKKEAQGRQRLSELEIERQKRRQGLLLERGRIMREMEESHKRRYLVLLERALAHVEAEIALLEQDRSS
ncbi:MAG TPA: hypothetical protein VFQ92_10895 [Blastocatellia bacterium]|nr:hypothetical protein [Blastocatellia bacterium]